MVKSPKSPPARKTKRTAKRTSASAADSLAPFHAAVSEWFRGTLGEPTSAQDLAWPAIQRGEHALLLSPTGSGKTLAAFLACLDELWRTLERGDDHDGVHTLYISPLKALNADVHRNLEAPLEGVRAIAEAHGTPFPEIRAAVRTGDTPAAARQAMLRKPPHILITTPESLFILLTSEKGQAVLKNIKYVIVDEIHAIAGTKRGVHLALTLERLANHAGEFQRIGLSATQRPLEEIARFLGGSTWEGDALIPRPVTILDAGRKKNFDIEVISAVEDFTEFGEGSVWPAIFYRLIKLIRAHKSTLVFANNRRLAERVAAQLNRMIEDGGDAPESVISVFDPGPSKKAGAKLAAAKIKKGKGGTKPRRGPGEEVVASGNGPIRAHHGSMSKEARREMEEDLKAGRLPALIATSSLELGIDVGHVDLVVLLQAPKGVSRGLQRIGRAGHQVGETSKGRIFATHKEDLVEAAVTTRAMLDGEVEETHVPKGCLDILAQQIAAAVAAEPRHEDALYKLVKQAYPYWELSRALYEEVLEMLGGKYPAQAFRELRPRIHRDRAQGMLTPLPGTRMLVMMNAGAIPDRGYFACVHVNGNTKLGELDEEFVFESRVGDVFLLGSSAWRIVAIDRDRVIVQEAPGEPARMPFWRGEAFGRPYELGRRIGAFRREIEPRLDDVDAPEWLAREYHIDANSSANVLQYLRRQRDATGVLPTDKRILVELFRDEIGDSRLAIHTSFGGRVNGPWALALRKRLGDRLGLEVEALYNDDGILLRFPDADTPPPTDILSDLPPDEAERILLDELGESALFAAQFRQNAERALLLPRQGGGKRTPFWLQRLRAGDLLQVARRFESFPIILETYRDAMREVLDVERLKFVLSAIDGGDIVIEERETDVPSPFAASLIFDFIGVYMYEWDRPKGEQKSQMLRLNRELLEEVLGKGSLRELLRLDAIEEVEASLQSTGADAKARNPDETAALLQRLGPLTLTEVERRHATGARVDLDFLETHGRVIQIPLRRRRAVTEWRYAAVEDAQLLKRAHTESEPARASERALLAFITDAPEGRPDVDLADAPIDPKRLPASLDSLIRNWHVSRRGTDDDARWVGFENALPASLREPPIETLTRADATRELVSRFLRTRGPVSLADIEDATALESQAIVAATGELVMNREIAEGEFRPRGTGREWVERLNFERIHRRTLALLRKEIEAVDLETFQDFLLHHQHVHPRARRQGKSGMEAILRQLHGASAPGEAWERAVLFNRVRAYEPTEVSSLVAGGEFLFVSTGESGRFSVLARGQGRGFVVEGGESKLSELAVQARDTLAHEGALFTRDLAYILDEDDERVLHALDALVRAGEVTNENFEVLRRVLRGEKLFTRSKGRRGLATELRMSTPWGSPLPKPRLGGFSTRAVGGRWSLAKTSSVLGVDAPRPVLAERVGRQLLERYGVVTRDIFARDGASSGPVTWNEVAEALKHLEIVGEVRRGLFVKDLHGLQFAMPDVVERLRARREQTSRDGEYILVNATDPACLYGTGIDHVLKNALGQDVKLARLASTSVVITGGRPVLIAEAFGRKLTTLAGCEELDLRQGVRAVASLMNLPAAMRPRRTLTVETLDGKPVIYGVIGEILEDAGFTQESRKMVLYPSRRK